jgi:hypothetical protein
MKGSIPVAVSAAILLVIAIYFAASAAAQLFLGLYPMLLGWSAEKTEAWVTGSMAAQFTYVLAVELFTMGMLVWYLRRKRIPLRDLGLVRPRLRDLGASIAAYVPYFLINAVATLTAAALLHVDLEQPQQTGFEAARSPTDLVLTFISLVILPPLVEEIVMRGFLFGSLKRHMTVIKAALVTSVLFALAHLQFGNGAPLLWVAAIDTFILSLVLCYLRQKTGSLWAGIGLHAIKNCLAFLTIFIFTR